MFFGFVLNKKISKFHYTNITQEYKSVLCYLNYTQVHLLEKLVEKNVIQLVREASGNRSNLYAFKDLMDIIES